VSLAGFFSNKNNPSQASGAAGEALEEGLFENY
jgi:hypothetical protein